MKFFGFGYFVFVLAYKKAVWAKKKSLATIMDAELGHPNCLISLHSFGAYDI